VADNRRARFDYEIGETFEAGLMLTGTEVKSLRTGKATVAESYAAVDRNGEIMLYNANIPEYLQANRFNHEPKRPRKLLLHTKEIATLAKGVKREGMRAEPRSLLRSDAARSCTTSAKPRRRAIGAATSRGSCASGVEATRCRRRPAGDHHATSNI
jgi:SsrA-binding protein